MRLHQFEKGSFSWINLVTNNFLLITLISSQWLWLPSVAGFVSILIERQAQLYEG